MIDSEWALKVQNKKGGSIHSTSINDSALYGETNSENKAAIIGITTNGIKEGIGVYGEARNGISSCGIKGTSIGGGFGVKGESEDGYGVHGSSINSEGVRGSSSNGKGVVGYSPIGDGVNGISENGNGVYGEVRQGDGAALKGISLTSGPAIYGLGQLAGRFEGDLIIDERQNTVAKGDVTVVGGSLLINQGNIKTGGTIDAQNIFVRGRSDIGFLSVESIECTNSIFQNDPQGGIFTKGEVLADGNISSKRNVECTEIHATGKISSNGTVECTDVNLKDIAEDFDLSTNEKVDPGTVMVIACDGRPVHIHMTKKLQV